MPTLLHIDASPRGDYSISRKVSTAFVESWKKKHADGKVIRRDLVTSNLTFVDLAWIAGAYTAPDQHTAEHKNALALSDTLIGELFSADQIVIGTPMYNFGHSRRAEGVGSTTLFVTARRSASERMATRVWQADAK